jgi:hypothetical protein
MKKANATERVAKPWGWDFRGIGQSSSDASKEANKRVFSSVNAERQRSSSEELVFVALGRLRTRGQAVLEGEKRWWYARV